MRFDAERHFVIAIYGVGNPASGEISRALATTLRDVVGSAPVEIHEFDWNAFVPHAPRQGGRTWRYALWFSSSFVSAAWCRASAPRFIERFTSSTLVGPQGANPRTNQNRTDTTPSARDFNANGAANHSHQRRARSKCDAPQNATIHKMGAPTITKYGVRPTSHRSGTSANSALKAASIAEAQKPTLMEAASLLIERYLPITTESCIHLLLFQTTLRCTA